MKRQYNHSKIEVKWPRMTPKKYNPKDIEVKWQKVWQEKGLHQTKDEVGGKDNYYCLVMFPYPSGDLHIGHWYNFAPADVFARYQRMKGENVLHPIGFDAFGLPAEGAAIKRKIHPSVWTKNNIKKMTEQLQNMGTIYDWSRVVNTSDPAYYHWTQWMFLQMFKHGLAYRKKATANWCPNCKSILANEQAEGGKCWRCEGPVEQREIDQWFFKITEYADELLEDLKKLDWPEKTLTMQKNWIGKSEGTLIQFPISPGSTEDLRRSLDTLDSSRVSGPRQSRDNFQFPKEKDFIEVFTTRPDTIFGVTFFVISPEHPLIASLLNSNFPASPVLPVGRQAGGQIPNSKLREIKNYIEKAKKKTELERIADIKKKTGVFTGLYVLNPLSGKKIPVYVADFVLMSYGTGAVMGVPGHDQRDWDFAGQHKLPIIEVISGGSIEKKAYTGEGRLVNSGKFNGLSSAKATQNISKYIEENNLGKRTVQYHLRDWLVSRQRYWGAPVPMIYCKSCAKKGITWWETEEGKKFLQNSQFPMTNFQSNPNDLISKQSGNSAQNRAAGWFAVSESELPVKLPKIKNYTPKEGESPLSRDENWVRTTCPSCGGPARRETDTMDTFVCSSWYYLAYTFWHKYNSKLKAQSSPACLSADRQDRRGRRLKAQKLKVFDEYKDLIKAWLPVDMYIGGTEHTVLHLLYSRFFTKALRDAGFLDFDEPFKALRHQGTILGEDGYKMSKSRGNVVNPDELVKKYGADTVRLYLCFMGPYDQGGPWNFRGIKGLERFLKRVWQLVNTVSETSKATKREEYWLNKTVKKVTEDISNFSFNTAIAALMEYINFIQKRKIKNKKLIKALVLLLAPFAPHMAEELWTTVLKEKLSVHRQVWPEYEMALTHEEEVMVVVEVDGKVRDRIKVKTSSFAKATEDKQKSVLVDLAKKSLKVKKYLMGKKIEKTIFVPGKLVNFVTAYGE